MEPVSTPLDTSHVELSISEHPAEPRMADFWIGPLVALGGMAARHAEEHPTRQLIVAVSVPRRDFAAALVGCGWVLGSQAPQLDPPMEALRGLSPKTPVRLVTEEEVVTDHFVQLHDTDDPRVELRKSRWLVSRVRAVSTLPSLESPLRAPRPRVGSLAQWAHLETSWDDRLASPAADLAIIGTRKWLEEDISASLSIGRRIGARSNVPAENEADSIAGLLLPKNEKAATWFTRLFASSRLADELPLPNDVRAAVLDGAGAIKYLTEIESPLVICILDRSVADNTAGEILVQLRNTRGEPRSLSEDLGWRTRAGIEALAFTVAL